MTTPHRTAATLIDARPPLADGEPWQLPAPRSLRLAGGTEVLAFDLPGKKLTGIKIALDTGSLADPLGKEGLAALSAYSLMTGINGGDGGELAARIEALGAHITTSAEVNAIFLAASATTEALGEVFEILAAQLASPTLAESELRLLIDQAILSAKMNASHAPYAAYEAALASLYPKSARYARPLTGSAQSLAAIETADIREFVTGRLARSHAKVVICGSLAGVDLAEVCAPLERWQAPGRFTVAGDGRAQVQAPTITLVDRADEPQTNVMLAAPTIPFAHPDRVALEVGIYALGGGTESPLWHALREEHGWTYGVQSYVVGGLSGASIHIASALANEAAPAAIDEILRIWRDYAAGAMTPERFSAARQEYVGALQSMAERAASIADAVASSIAADLPYDRLSRTIEEAKALSYADVQAALAAHADPAGAHIVAVGSAQALAPALSHLSPPIVVKTKEKEHHD